MAPRRRSDGTGDECRCRHPPLQLPLATRLGVVKVLLVPTTLGEVALPIVFGYLRIDGYGNLLMAWLR